MGRELLAQSGIISVDSTVTLLRLAQLAERAVPIQFRYSEWQQERSKEHAIFTRVWVPRKNIKHILDKHRAKRPARDILLRENDPLLHTGLRGLALPGKSKHMPIKIVLEFFDPFRTTNIGRWPPTHYWPEESKHFLPRINK